MTLASRALPALLLSAALASPGGAPAATCREAIDRFERELDASGIAASDPDRYAELARAAEEAAELRDEAVCMQRVAELDAELDRVAGSDPEDGVPRAARPAPPMLLEAPPDE
jgi:hypothetical protein